MPTTDPRVDAYIAKAAPFARPILEHLRAVVHEGCPDVVETIKWGMPAFERGGILCTMAAFQAHCAFGFWNGAEVLGREPVADDRPGMGQFGRIATIDDLPPRDVLVGHVRRAAELRAAGVTRPSSRKGATTTRRAAKPEVEVPEVVRRALDANDAARAAFDAFSPSHRREYVEWIVDAKTDATRERRLAQMLEWLAEGKSRNWKYERR